MVWAGIMYYQRTERMIVQGNLMGKGYIDEIVRPVTPVAVPFSQSIMDEASSTRTTTHVHYIKLMLPFSFLRPQCVRALQRPAKSPRYVPN